MSAPNIRNKVLNEDFPLHASLINEKGKTKVHFDIMGENHDMDLVLTGKIADITQTLLEQPPQSSFFDRFKKREFVYIKIEVDIQQDGKTIKKSGFLKVSTKTNKILNKIPKNIWGAYKTDATSELKSIIKENCSLQLGLIHHNNIEKILNRNENKLENLSPQEKRIMESEVNAAKVWYEQGMGKKDDSEAHAYLGRLFLLVNDNEKAIDEFTKAIEGKNGNDALEILKDLESSTDLVLKMNAQLTLAQYYLTQYQDPSEKEILEKAKYYQLLALETADLIPKKSQKQEYHPLTYHTVTEECIQLALEGDFTKEKYNLEADKLLSRAIKSIEGPFFTIDDKIKAYKKLTNVFKVLELNGYENRYLAEECNRNLSDCEINKAKNLLNSLNPKKLSHENKQTYQEALSLLQSAAERDPDSIPNYIEDIEQVLKPFALNNTLAKLTLASIYQMQYNVSLKNLKIPPSLKEFNKVTEEVQKPLNKAKNWLNRASKEKNKVATSELNKFNKKISETKKSLKDIHSDYINNFREHSLSKAKLASLKDSMSIIHEDNKTEKDENEKDDYKTNEFFIKNYLKKTQILKFIYEYDSKKNSLEKLLIFHNFLKEVEKNYIDKVGKNLDPRQELNLVKLILKNSNVNLEIFDSLLELPVEYVQSPLVKEIGIIAKIIDEKNQNASA